MGITESTARQTPRPKALSPIGVTWLGMGANVALAALKAGIGLLTGSQALLADGLHSLSDMVSDLAVLAGLRASAKPADSEHHYGHHRVQTLVTLVIGLLILGAAAMIGLGAARTWLDGRFTAYGWLPFAMALVSVAVKETMYRMTARVGRRSGDPALRANAWHHRSDAVSSLAAGAGMLAVAIGGQDWAFVDQVTALGLSGFLIAVGLRLAFQAAQELIDRAPDPALTARMDEVIAGTDGVRSHHEFRMRQLGGKYEMDVHIQVQPDLTVAEGHDIATEVRRRVIQTDPKVTTCIVHVEPIEQT